MLYKCVCQGQIWALYGPEGGQVEVTCQVCGTEHRITVTNNQSLDYLERGSSRREIKQGFKRGNRKRHLTKAERMYAEFVEFYMEEKARYYPDPEIGDNLGELFDSRFQICDRMEFTQRNYNMTTQAVALGISKGWPRVMGQNVVGVRADRHHAMGTNLAFKVPRSTPSDERVPSLLFRTRPPFRIPNRPY